MAYTIQRLFAFCISLSLSSYTNKCLVAAENTCGSLITYRQYSTTLEHAPQCFIDGCTSNTRPSSMSDTCPQGQACSQLWNLISGEYQQSWCSNCTKDIACRIPGWPILNASAVCDITPNTWLFGNQGSCCTAGNQSYELASWVGKMCNGSEWRSPFHYYGGMAMLDWEEWLLPWNWTVRPENTTVVKLAPASCPGRPLALLAFAAENVLFLLFAVGVSAAKLAYIHGRETDRPWARRIRNVCHPLTWLKFWQWKKKYGKWRLRRERRRQGLDENTEDDVAEEGSNEDREVLFGVLWSVFMTGLQVGFNFVSAYLIKQSPGYQNVPLGRLALLFCCRPRLSWVASLLEHTKPETLKDRFGIEKPKYVQKAKITLGSIGIGSAISEITLQGISSYFMVLTADTGRSRGFYLVHHLRPYWRGADAQAMYLGALFWLIAFVFVFLAWLLAFYYGIKLLRLYHRGLDQIKKSLRKTKKTVWPPWKVFPHRPINPPPSDGGNNELFPRLSEEGNNEILPPDPERIDAGVGPGHAGERVDPALHGPPEGEVERIGHHPIHIEEGDQNERVTGHATPANITSEGDMNERVGTTTSPTHEGDRNERLDPTDRRLSPQSHGSGSETLLGQGTIGSQLSSTAVNEGPIVQNVRPTHANTARDYGNLPQDDPFRTPENEPKEEIQEGQPPPGETLEHQDVRDKKALFINSAVAIGFLAWIFQWMFWAGFVYTSGQRFCPPKLIPVAVAWIAASLTGLGVPMAAQ